MALDGLGQFIYAEINGALADTVAVGVAVNAGQCAWLTHGEHEVVKLAGISRMRSASSSSIRATALAN
jgi:hypothetical protein